MYGVLCLLARVSCGDLHKEGNLFHTIYMMCKDARETAHHWDLQFSRHIEAGETISIEKLDEWDMK